MEGGREVGSLGSSYSVRGWERERWKEERSLPLLVLKCEPALAEWSNASGQNRVVKRERSKQSGQMRTGVERRDMGRVRGQERTLTERDNSD